ncbi:hypothetical protein HYX03_03685 [Candidatus Woesearchaeota archaeon]|nr:hypothetical protein [Candidatus Woesearchaeota archaeon]
MDISKYDLVIKRHVFERAMQRGIHPDLIEDTLFKGKIKRFGKHGIKFINRGSKRTIICVGELIGDKLKIMTIEEGN